MNSIEKDLKRKQKALRKEYLLNINKTLHKARSKNNGHIPHKMVQTIVNNSKETCPQLIRDIINKSFKTYLMNE